MTKTANSSTAVMWFRRDLRLRDNPALVAASQAAGGMVAGLFVVDEILLAGGSQARNDFMADALRHLDLSMKGELNLVAGGAVNEVVKLVKAVGAKQVFVTEEFTPYAIERDLAVASALQEIGAELVKVDSPYVIPPGVIKNLSGMPYKVFGGFRKVWESLSSEITTMKTPRVTWVNVGGAKAKVTTPKKIRPSYFGESVESQPETLPEASEAAALELIKEFATKSAEYGEDRNIPAISGTSRLSPYLRFGIVHPRQILAGVSRTNAGGITFASEIAWRDFYADVLFTNPHSRYEALQPKMGTLRSDYDEVAIERFQAWTRGQTGYPLVDAGMRQLLAEGWMHNRVRMVTASFLIKHLHVDWRWGAQWFMCNLIDGDIASNQHGWQWVAGTGTDAAPFHRIFNPTLQAERFDPTGSYIKRYVPELREVQVPECLRPMGGTLLGGLDYIAPIVDHNTERIEALARLAEISPEKSA